MTSSADLTSREACVARDSADPLRNFREPFVIPEGIIYLDGNSLGPMPRGAVEVLGRTIEQEWGRDLIKSWNSAGWFDMPARLGDRVGALIGAAPGQTLVCDTTSINLYKAIQAAIGLRPGRDVIIAEDESFPTDLYIVEGAMKSAGRSMKRRLIGADSPSIEALLDEKVAVAVLSHVNYRTGALLDMAAITRQLHDAGALVVWDLCHSIGVVEIAFDLDAVDFAVGCTYKYLNGGPGSPAFIAVATAHQATAQHPLSGWWGHAAPFAFDRDFRPDAGIKRFLCGTQPIISLRGVDVALDAMEGVEVAALRQKSLALTELFMARVAALLPGLQIVTPRQPALRGSQVGICLDKGYAVIQAMIARGVIGDFRAPDLMRFGFAPLYVRFQDVWDAAEILAECINAEVWRDPHFNRKLDVT
ncbi:kynureninase [Bradyrhizobium erythrophlei]|jgi:kynureninase|uniref:Kynureninase n=1 Tax=Bradyrhizobium erythrophlei TaxID=1437360 RepID=A0A1M5UVJ9_9BRAD|nr:kynureninase [Bradyrhizobium erythrophlei]SHH67047.1 Kynureninase [Bradyrhizobium erythrophlei]